MVPSCRSSFFRGSEVFARSGGNPQAEKRSWGVFGFSPELGKRARCRYRLPSDAPFGKRRAVRRVLDAMRGQGIVWASKGIGPGDILHATSAENSADLPLPCARGNRRKIAGVDPGSPREGQLPPMAEVRRRSCNPVFIHRWCLDMRGKLPPTGKASGSDQNPIKTCRKPGCSTNGGTHSHPRKSWD